MMTLSSYPTINLVVIGMSFAGSVLQIIIVTWPVWFVYHSNGTDVTGGLWSGCDRSLEENPCNSYPEDEVPDFIKATRAMELLGYLCMVTVSVLVVLKTFLMKDRDILITAGVVTAFAAGVSTQIGIIVFASSFKAFVPEASRKEAKLGAGFILSITFPVLSFVLGAILIFIKTKKLQRPEDTFNNDKPDV